MTASTFLALFLMKNMVQNFIYIDSTYNLILQIFCPPQMLPIFCLDHELTVRYGFME